MSEDEKLIQAVKALNAAGVIEENLELRLGRRRGNHDPVVRLVDRRTGIVMRRIPAGLLLRTAEALRNYGGL